MSANTETGAPNLDCQPRRNLTAFVSAVKDGPRKVAGSMFPTKPRGYLRATRDLARYAMLKQTAMLFREQGMINAAMHYEAACEAIYKRLPDFARW